VAQNQEGVTDSFPVFVGFDERQAEAAAVTEFSIREHASIPVDITLLGAGRPPIETFQKTATTAFTYCRFLMPHLRQYEGRAFFCDCDVLVLGDIAELAEYDMDGCAVMVVRHQFKQQDRPRSWSSVMLMDCSKLTNWTPSYVQTASDDELMRFRSLQDHEIGNLPPQWHVMAREDGSFNEPASLIHWSYLSSPDGGSWIDRSKNSVWQAWRDRWRQQAESG
jgi:Glycosyl transferase family 8